MFLCEGELYLRGYAGSALRGVFGHALRRVVCALPRQECPGCLLLRRCPYPAIFETPRLDDGITHTPRPSQYPHPFVLVPPLERDRLLSVGAPFHAELVLMGPAREVLPYLILACQEMGRFGLGSQRVPFRLSGIEMRQTAGWCNVYDPAQGVLTLPPEQDDCEGRVNSLREAHHLWLHTRTPLRMTADNRLVRRLTFTLFLRSLLRRLDDLARLYGTGPLPVDIPDLLHTSREIVCQEDSMHWTDFTRYSNRQQRSQTLGGLEGSLLLAGDFVPFLEWLVLGERLHVGKATSFGFGRYYLEAA